MTFIPIPHAAPTLSDLRRVISAPQSQALPSKPFGYQKIEKNGVTYARLEFVRNAGKVGTDTEDQQKREFEEMKRAGLGRCQQRGETCDGRYESGGWKVETVAPKPAEKQKRKNAGRPARIKKAASAARSHRRGCPDEADAVGRKNDFA
jgi:hypothetical protein